MGSGEAAEGTEGGGGGGGRRRWLRRRCCLVERTNEAEIGDAKVWQWATVAQLHSDVAPKEPLIALKSLQMGTLTFVSAVHDHQGERSGVLLIHPPRHG